MVKVGGLKIKELCDMMGISRMTLSRYRKDPYWPSDDAPIDIIKAFIISKRPANGSGRKKKQSVAPASPVAGAATVPNREPGDVTDELDDEYNKLGEMLDFDKELKRTVIEKNKTQIASYQLKAMEERRERLNAKLQRAFKTVIDELREMDLTQVQLANLGRAFDRALVELELTDGDDDIEQPELNLTDEVN